MMLKSEILFVDPSVSDIATILGGLRPEVEAIVLDSSCPAARQIAQALRDRRGLDAVHVIAHGSPGRVRFAAGEWSAEMLEDSWDDFGCIGASLRPEGRVRLWTCHTGVGAAGGAFIASLAQKVGAQVDAATTRIGSAELGGQWELSLHAGAAAAPPLTEAGVASYMGILAPFELTVTGSLPSGNTTRSITYFIIDTTRSTIVSQVVLPDAVKQNNSVSVTVKVPNATGPFAIGTFNDDGVFQRTSFLSVNNPATQQSRTGAIGQ